MGVELVVVPPTSIATATPTAAAEGSQKVMWKAALVGPAGFWQSQPYENPPIGSPHLHPRR